MLGWYQFICDPGDLGTNPYGGILSRIEYQCWLGCGWLKQCLVSNGFSRCFYSCFYYPF